MSLLHRPRLLVFDLDGTLIDSQIDLAKTINAMLVRYHQPQLGLDVIAGYIGDGAQELVRRALLHAGDLQAGDLQAGDLQASDLQASDLQAAAPLLEEATAWFLAYYRIHKLDHTYVYPGVMEALASIHAAHPRVQMAVLTNKPVAPSRDICVHFGLDRFCFQVHGGNSFPTKKPHPAGLQALIMEASHRAGSTISPSETVMIGDSHVDVQTARACGTQALGCTYGLSPATLRAAAPDVLVDHPAEWPQALTLT